jgi:hypothetical protein
MSARLTVVGRGVVGERIARRASVLGDVEVSATSTGHGLRSSAADVVILAGARDHAEDVVALIERGIDVVSVGDGVADVQSMLDLDDLAVHHGVAVVVGAAMSPGLTELLVRHLAGRFARVDEIHVAAHGTAGPACARQHHRRLAGRAIGWHDDEWITRPAGSGRELCFFPEPVGAYDCYRADMVSPILLHRAFPEAKRISARVSANRRDRLTAWLPMLTPPHREGGAGAIRVEVRGSATDGSRQVEIVGLAEQVATAAAATALAMADAIIRRTIEPGVVTCADGSFDVGDILTTVERLGVRLQEFTGVPNIEGRPAAPTTEPLPA